MVQPLPTTQIKNLYDRAHQAAWPLGWSRALAGLPAVVHSKLFVSPDGRALSADGMQASALGSMAKRAAQWSQSPVGHAVMTPVVAIALGTGAPVAAAGLAAASALAFGTGATQPAGRSEPASGGVTQFAARALRYGVVGAATELLGAKVGAYGHGMAAQPTAGVFKQLAGNTLGFVGHMLSLSAALVLLVPRLGLAAAVTACLLVSGTLLAASGTAVEGVTQLASAIGGFIGWGRDRAPHEAPSPA